MNLQTSSIKFKILKRKLSPHTRPALRVFAVAVIALLGFFIIRQIPTAFSAIGDLVSKPFRAIRTVNNPASALEETSGRTNILILGKGGAFHEAPDLTDTIIVASIRLSDMKLNLISIPRDIWINSMKAKINSAYYYGEQRQSGGGGVVLAKDAVFQVTNLPIHYAVVIDFQAFKEAIDIVDGIDIDIKREFTDEKYPKEVNNEQETVNNSTEITEDLYETVRFEKGWQHMDGELALKYARSRNSTDPEEGTDFARSRRQQQVLLALSAKIKSTETALSPERLKELQGIFEDYVETDLTTGELLALARIGVNIELNTLKTLTLDVGTKEDPGLLINPPVNKVGQWVLEPRAGNWDEVHDAIQAELGE